MKNFKLSIIFSEIFKIFIIFMLVLIWARYFIKKTSLAIIISCLLTFLIDTLIILLSKKKFKKQTIKNTELKKISDITNSLIFDDEKNVVDFFYNLAKCKHTAIKKSKYVIVPHQDGNVALYPFFTFRSFNTDDLIMIYNKLGGQLKRIVICTHKIDPMVYKLAEKLNTPVVVLDYEQTYLKLLKPYDFYPEIKLNLKNIEKPNYKDLLCYSLNKNRTKGYMLSSMVLLFSSFFVSYAIYYIIMSSVLLILSFISFINPKFNKTPNNELL